MNNNKHTYLYKIKVVECHSCSGCGKSRNGGFSGASGSFMVTGFDGLVRIPTVFISSDGFVDDWFVERLSERRNKNLSG